MSDRDDFTTTGSDPARDDLTATGDAARRAELETDSPDAPRRLDSSAGETPENIETEAEVLGEPGDAQDPEREVTKPTESGETQAIDPRTLTAEAGAEPGRVMSALDPTREQGGNVQGLHLKPGVAGNTGHMDHDPGIARARVREEARAAATARSTADTGMARALEANERYMSGDRERAEASLERDPDRELRQRKSQPTS